MNTDPELELYIMTATNSTQIVESKAILNTGASAIKLTGIL